MSLSNLGANGAGGVDADGSGPLDNAAVRGAFCFGEEPGPASRSYGWRPRLQRRRPGPRLSYCLGVPERGSQRRDRANFCFAATGRRLQRRRLCDGCPLACGCDVYPHPGDSTCSRRCGATDWSGAPELCRTGHFVVLERDEWEARGADHRGPALGG